MDNAKRKYKVLLPVHLPDSDAPVWPGAVVELDLATAREYQHALIAIEEE